MERRGRGRSILPWTKGRCQRRNSQNRRKTRNTRQDNRNIGTDRQSIMGKTHGKTKQATLARIPWKKEERKHKEKRPRRTNGLGTNKCQTNKSRQKRGQR